MDFTSEIRTNMEEKLDWAARSVIRMNEARQGDPVTVQDQFWSFLHAVHLIWFYFGRWVKQERPKATSKSLVQTWKGQSLSPEELNAWDQLSALRNEDAHVQPVVAREPKGGHLCKDPKTGHLRKSASTGHLMRSKHKPYRVAQGVLEVELFSLCEKGMLAFRKFVNTFDSL